MASPSTEQPKHDDRSWQDIATELSQETNPDKLTELTAELNHALDKDKNKEDEAKRPNQTAA